MAKSKTSRLMSAAILAKTILKGDPRATGREIYRSSRMMHYVGAFIDRYGAVEIQITRVFCHVLKQDDFERFEALVLGMDLPRKIRGMKHAMRFYPRGGKIGPQIKARLEVLRDIIEMRNNLVHSYLELRDEIVWCNTLGRMTDAWDGENRPLKTRPDGYSLREVVKATLWLHSFFFDLNDLAANTHNHLGNFEVIHPRTTKYKVRRLAPHAGAHTTRRTRARKARKPPPT